MSLKANISCVMTDDLTFLYKYVLAEYGSY